MASKEPKHDDLVGLQSDESSGKRATEVSLGDNSKQDPTAVPEALLVCSSFAMTVGLSTAAFLAVVLVFTHGVSIDGGIRDKIGSSKNAEARVEIYQAINGYVTAAIAMVMESYFAVFIAVAGMFLTNVQWYAGDNPQAGPSHFKLLGLWAFTTMILFALKVAITAAFVGYSTTKVVRAFANSDLVATAAYNKSDIVTANLSTMGNSVSVLDTILSAAVRQKVTPFKMLTDSPCIVKSEKNVTDRSTEVYPSDLPTVKEVRSTAVVYGFPSRSWNLDAMPFGLNPTQEYEFDVSDISASDFDAFQKKSQVSWTTMYELLLQGKLLFERSVSDSNASATYDCTLSDSSAKATRTYNVGNVTITSVVADEKDIGKCRGAISSLKDFANVSDASMHTPSKMSDLIVNGFKKTIPQLAANETTVTIATYDINPQMKLTSFSVDMRYVEGTQYRDTTASCDGDQLKASVIKEYHDPNPVTLEADRRLLCDQTYYPYENTRSTCGPNSCIFLDASSTLPLKQQFQLMPYLESCSVANLTYNADYLNFFPSGCTPREDAVFLYGLGSYMGGETFTIARGTNLTAMTYPQRRVKLVFAKLEWRTEDLSSKFKAKCNATHLDGDTDCSGLLHKLENVTVPAVNLATSKEKYVRFLMLGSRNLPSDRLGRDYRNPVPLMSLNMRPLYYEKQKRYFQWEYVDKGNFESVDWPADRLDSGGLRGEECSPLVDSYITFVEANHLYMDHVLQPLYTSALFYLFQDAAVKTVEVSKNVTNGTEVFELSVVGTTSLKGDLEKHVIKFSIPLLSLISTFVGLAILVVLVAFVLLKPTERLRKTKHESVALQYLHFVQNDEYPKELFDRAITLPSGERVPIDEYVVDSATMHYKQDKDKKLFL